MLWKIYAWIFLILNVLYPIGRTKVIPAWFVALTMAVNLPAVFGLFLYSYKKRWLTPIFWKIYFFLFLAWQLRDILFMIKKGLILWNLPIMILFYLPAFVALFLYAYRPSLTSLSR